MKDEIKFIGKTSGNVEIGIYDSLGKYWKLSTNDCCETLSNGRRSCVPSSDCSKNKFEIHWQPQSDKISIESADGRGTYPIWDDARVSGAIKFSVKVPSGGTVTDFQIVSKDIDYVRHHESKGATKAFAGSGSKLCSSESATCGSSCWSVCDGMCMCYPKGYYGVSGTFHPGAACLKSCGDGKVVEAASHGVDEHVAYAGGRTSDPKTASTPYVDANDDGFDDDILEAFLRAFRSEL